LLRHYKYGPKLTAAGVRAFKREQQIKGATIAKLAAMFDLSDRCAWRWWHMTPRLAIP
jgi:hypothetical protein